MSRGGCDNAIVLRGEICNDLVAVLNGSAIIEWVLGIVDSIGYVAYQVVNAAWCPVANFGHDELVAPAESVPECVHPTSDVRLTDMTILMHRVHVLIGDAEMVCDCIIDMVWFNSHPLQPLLLVP